MKHIVFDLGQVLINWAPEQAFAGYFPDPSAMREWMRRVDFHGWNYLQDGGRPLAEGLAAARSAHGEEAAPFEDYTANFPLTIQERVPGSWEIANELKSAGHRLFAITNWSRDNWPAALTCHPQLETLFEDIVVSGIEGLLKPEPEIYHTLLDRNGIEARDCIFIDDSAANVDGAKAVGMEAIHFTTADALRDALRKSGI